MSIIKNILKASFILSFLFLSCSPKVHENFESNHYIKDYRIHSFNDSLKLSFNSPSDIIYSTDKVKLIKQLRKSNINLSGEVLFFGITKLPEYEFYVTVSLSPENKLSVDLFKYDTIIENNFITFIGRPHSEAWVKPMNSDLKYMVNSLVVGKGYQDTKPTIFDVINKYSNSNNFYPAFTEIQRFPTFNENDEWTKLQFELTFSSFLGITDNYLELLDKYESEQKLPPELLEKVVFNSKNNVEPISSILSEAKKTNLLMINENHFYPHHRSILFELLPKLKNIGYNTLAIEALYPNQDSILNLPDSYPTINSGFYTREQNFGNILRLAKELDFQLVSYDDFDNPNEREYSQAKNLYNKTFKIKPHSKVIVLAGIDHILEKETTSNKKWMATVFKENYQIDPLTISQTHLNTFRHVLKADYTLIKGSQFDNHTYSSVDYHLINNKYDNTVFDNYFDYINETKWDVQLSLFLTDEVDSSYQNKIPYFTTILKPGVKHKLPYYQNKNISIVTYNLNGEIISESVKTPLK